jgi:hypothetical protein
MLLAYRIGGQSTADAELAEIASKILYNGTAGLMDLNLNQQQKLIFHIKHDKILIKGEFF